MGYIELPLEIKGNFGADDEVSMIAKVEVKTQYKSAKQIQQVLEFFNKTMDDILSVAVDADPNDEFRTTFSVERYQEANYILLETQLTGDLNLLGHVGDDNNTPFLIARHESTGVDTSGLANGIVEYFLITVEGEFANFIVDFVAFDWNPIIVQALENVASAIQLLN